jgi:hypothetical protein
LFIDKIKGINGVASQMPLGAGDGYRPESVPAPRILGSLHELLEPS